MANVKESKTNSKSLTSSTADRNSLTGACIVEIIKAGAECGIKELKFETLAIRFGAFVEKEQPKPEQVITETQMEAVHEEEFVKSEIEIREEQIEMALLENPALAEKLLSDSSNALTSFPM